MSITTPLTKLFGIKHPIILAGMNQAAGPELAAAVTNAGGLGVIGGVGYTPDFLRKQIGTLKANLVDKNAPFGVDLLLPQVGGNARKTNFDYTQGKLPELIDIIIEEKAKLFVSAVGVPPQWAVDKLHKAGIAVMNVIGAPKHVRKALDAGCDLICAQGGEGGGHTGDVATSILIPKVVDMAKHSTSPLTGGPVLVVAAGGIFDGRGLAASLCWGAQGVWVGTRFICAKEAGATPRHQQAVIDCGFHDTVRTIIFTGRPLRCLKNDYILDWENNRPDEIKALTSKGVIPVMHDIEERTKGDSDQPKDKKEKLASMFPVDKPQRDPIDPAQISSLRPMLLGQAAAAVTAVMPAADIVDEMIRDAVAALGRSAGLTAKL